jgi:TolA-binding protein
MRAVKFFLLATVLILPMALAAQRTSIYNEPDAAYRAALELFNKQKYGAAKELFRKVVAQIDDPYDETRGSALYYSGICAAELFNPDAEALLVEYINTYPTHPGQNLARFQMGNLNYRKRNYREAVEWFSSFNGNRLEPGKRLEYLFKKGYSHFMTEEFPAARQALAQIKDPASPYYAPATYYYGHIGYLEGDYDMALESFRRLSRDENFGPVIPYYITHIHYLQENFDALLEYAPGLLEEASPRRAGEISRLIGEAYFRREAFKEAIPYLERHLRESGASVTREDHYQIGFSYYKTGDYSNAIRHLERATNATDELAQNAWYHLADAYIQTNQKRFARNAFNQAYQLGHAGFITRESLFNYAKLSYELSLDPYNEAILSFQRYIDDYPDSERATEANTYLIDLYLTTSNYKEALTSIERMNINTPRLREAFQRISYYRGVELFNNGSFPDAIAHFQKARRFSENPRIYSQSLFWEGEANYRLEQYDQSVRAHEAFLVSPGANALDIFNRAHYSIGYAHFKKKDYPRAINAFRRFIADTREDRRLLNDAHLRLADSYFITKNYQQALTFYDSAIRIGVIDNDYAAFQKALAYGVMGRFEDKVVTLQQFLNTYGRSSYADDAKYELANTNLVLNNSQQAMAYFNQVINQHPNSSYVKSAMLKTGLIHFNNNEDERALAVFKKVVSDYPGSPESQEALGTIRNIYVSLDQVDEFVRYSSNLGFADITTAQQDSLSYVAAESRYMQGDCENAIRSFTNYLERFPNGIFSLNALFYRSECEFRRNNFNQAMAGYKEVIARPKSKFSENALSRASQIEFRQGNYAQAHEYFKNLEEVAEFPANVMEARIGKMRSLYRLGRLEEAIAASREVLNTDKVPQEILQESHLIIGLAAMGLQDHETARQALARTAGLAENRMAAEALYNLILIEFRLREYEKAETMVFEHVNRLSAYDYWLAKTFLLLADVYMETDNDFQAKHTLQSIIENYDGEDLRKQAEQKLQIVIEREQGEDSGDKDPIEVDFGNSGNQ